MEGVKIKKIAVLTSGGDAPGMNAAVRAVVRTALYHGIKVVGVRRGYEGLLREEMPDVVDLNARSVSDTMQRGGTILLTARCMEMMTPEGQDKAAQRCKDLGFDALIVIGGDGSLNGGLQLVRRGVNIIGIPGTIDLDLKCTDYTIGFDTAVSTGMDAISKLRDTSSSHERCSVVEVMGRGAGYIALWCGLTGGAEEVLIPEEAAADTKAVIEQIRKNRLSGKTHNLVVVAEGIGGTIELAKQIEAETSIETRATILGHLQRGGSPTAVDRMHASVMGYMAVDILTRGYRNRVVVSKNGGHDHLDLEEALAVERPYDPYIYNVLKILSV
ncbi:MAG: 6-phosphofructokinase [Clostridiales bacterium]|jgi:6-phosphofructokinase 1|nr:6-phosphofructokinase [Clostridiales bacterium]